jgi:CRISPR-associated protein Csb1
MNETTKTKMLTLADLKSAITGSAAGFRCRTRLQPAGGESSKIFPPTYAGGPYATEDRVIHIEENGEKKVVKVPTVLLDSVQSQANRMELTLLQGYREGKLRFPLIEVDFTDCAGDGTPTNNLTDLVDINSLTAPHRIADAILRDSMVGTAKFRDSAIGQRFVNVSSRNATSLLELCPTALVFGMWDSTGPRGGLGAKFARALVSEIVGFAGVKGVRAGIRKDPLEIEVEGVPVYQAKDEVASKTGFPWTVVEDEAKRVNGKAVLYAKKGKATELNHSNILVGTYSEKAGTYVNQEGQEIPGGFTISYALQTTVLSLPALRRLSFPVAKKNGESDADFKQRQGKAHDAARTALAALALAAVAWSQKAGYDLRSGCLLVPEDVQKFELLGANEGGTFTLDAGQAAELLEGAVSEATDLGLPWPVAPIRLTPSSNLQALIRKSRAKVATSPVTE